MGFKINRGILENWDNEGKTYDQICEEFNKKEDLLEEHFRERIKNKKNKGDYHGRK